MHGFSSELHTYFLCQENICKKQKKNYTKHFDKIILNPNSKCKKYRKKIEAKYDVSFLREQETLIAKTLGRKYINYDNYREDMQKLEEVLDSELMKDKDFMKTIHCRKKLDKATLKRDKCILKKCGPEPPLKGGKRRSTRRLKKRKNQNINHDRLKSLFPGDIIPQYK